jgi:hypothetical protein
MMVVSLAVRVPLQIAMPDTTVQAYEPGRSASDVFEAMLPQLGFVMALSMIANLLVQLVSSVFLPLVTALLYIDQRIRREGLAHTLELASRSDA